MKLEEEKRKEKAKKYYEAKRKNDGKNIKN